MKHFPKLIAALSSLILASACKFPDPNCSATINPDETLLNFDSNLIANQKIRIVTNGVNRVNDCDPNSVIDDPNHYFLDRSPNSVLATLVIEYAYGTNVSAIHQESFELYVRPDCFNSEIRIGQATASPLTFQEVTFNENPSCTQSYEVAQARVTFQ